MHRASLRPSPLQTVVATQLLYRLPDANVLNASAAGNPYGLQGLPVDVETGLAYFRNRYYDPALGRFVSADPKGYVDGPSIYAFEMNDPANAMDPLGTCASRMSVTDCIMADDRAFKRAQEESERKKKEHVLDRLIDWVGDTAVGIVVKEGVE